MMNYKLKSSLLLLLLFVAGVNIAQIDTTYLDKNWGKCGKYLAMHYRTTEKQGDVYLMKEYDKETNVLKLAVYCSQLEPERVYDGKVIYYTDKGKKEIEGTFVKDERSGIWTIWHEGEKDSLVIDCNIDGTYKNVYVPASQEMNKEMNVSYKTEIMPEFPGGNSAMYQFLMKNMQYPQVSKESGIMGTCYVTFVVESDGSLTDIRVLRGVKNGPDLDAEALRVVKLMPNWTPGEQFGRKVKVQFNLPVKFRLR